MTIVDQPVGCAQRQCECRKGGHRGGSGGVELDHNDFPRKREQRDEDDHAGSG